MFGITRNSADERYITADLGGDTNNVKLLVQLLNLAFAIALVYKSFEIDYLKSEKKKGARCED